MMHGQKNIKLYTVVLKLVP